MANISSKDIRNICFLGHGQSGKTSLLEAMLYVNKGIDRLGKVPDGNTVGDYDPEEIKRKFSIQASLAPVPYKGRVINVIDTPGFFDFAGEAKQALRVVGNAIIVINGKSGVESGAELAWDLATEAGVPKAFFINRLDEENIKFERIINELTELFGHSVCPLIIPYIEHHRVVAYIDVIDSKAFTYDANGVATPIEFTDEFARIAEIYKPFVYDAIAETDDSLMEKYFAEEPFTQEEIVKGLNAGIISGKISPVFCGSAVNLAGLDFFMDYVTHSFPNPIERKQEITPDGTHIKLEPEGAPTLFVFKTVADPFVGKMSYFKVVNGILKKDSVLKNVSTGQTEKISHIYVMKGKKQIEVEEMVCGDIGVTTKLVSTNTNDTLSAIEGTPEYKKIQFPEPVYSMAVAPLAKGDEDKISSGISKLLEEDHTIKYYNNPETKQMILTGLGEMHLDVIKTKLKNRFQISVDLIPEKIAYRETIRKSVKVEGKHKKQSGGHGQYGHVKIEFSPGEEEGLVFTESIFGGSVPKNFHPAVEKGLLESMKKGVLAGYPVVRLKANLFDGSYHDVDSSEMSFKLAANLAFKEGMRSASPVLLEPIGQLNVRIPDSLMGDVFGDITKRRGRVLGTTADDNKKGYSIVEAEVPKSEMANYAVNLRAMSQGRASYTFAVTSYSEVPESVAQKVIEAAKKEMEQ